MDQLDFFIEQYGEPPAIPSQVPPSPPAPPVAPIAAQERPELAPMATPAELKPAELAGEGQIDVDGNRFQVRFAYNQILIAYCKMIARSNAAKDCWDPIKKVWRFPFRAAPDLQHFKGFTWSEQALKVSVEILEKLLLKEQATAEQMAPWLEKIRNHGQDLTAQLPDGKTLMVHQREAIPWMLEKLKCILADEMGLGKTITALMAAKIIYDATKLGALIITKASLVRDWQDAARGIRHPHFAVYSWAAIPDQAFNQKFVLICDEAHFMQNIKSQRTKRILALTENAIAIFLLTGTPIKNGDPMNVFPLFKAIGHPVAAKQNLYERRYCKPKWVCKRSPAHFKLKEDPEKDRRDLEWDCTNPSCRAHNKIRWHFGIKKYECFACGNPERKPDMFPIKGADNLDELHKHLKPVMLQRLKKDCIDLPAKTRIILEVETTEEMQKIYLGRFQKALADYTARVEAGDIKAEGEALAILTYIRMAASLGKVPAAIELAEEIIEGGGTPIIFTEYKESIFQICEHFKVPAYTGDFKGDRRQIVTDFQNGKIPLFGGTREAGGTGLTLTRGNYVIMVDRPLTPGDVDQAEDRAHRIGQLWPVTAYHLQGFDICRTIDHLQAKKRRIIAAVLSGDQKTVTGSGSMSAQEVLKELFRGGK